MREGDEVPDFELPDHNGTPRRLSTLLTDGPIVLFFYPAAMTVGCTKEACHFRDLAAEFAAAGVQRVGISRDSVAKQKQFADKHAFDYPLLSDVDGTVAGIFGVKRGKVGERLIGLAILPELHGGFGIGGEIVRIHLQLRAELLRRGVQPGQTA